MTFEHLDAQAEPFLEEDEPLLPMRSETGTPFSALFPDNATDPLWAAVMANWQADTELWKTTLKDTREVMTDLFGENWHEAVIFRDGTTDRFFCRVLVQGNFKLTDVDFLRAHQKNKNLKYTMSFGKSLPEAGEVWQNIKMGFHLPADQSMGQYGIIRNKTAVPEFLWIAS